MITFNGEAIKCGDVHSFLELKGGELIARRTHFWGIRGISEIVSTTAPWVVECICWLNDDEFAADQDGLNKLQNYMKDLRALRGTNGELQHKLTGGRIANTWQDATFEGFQAIPFDGHEFASPIEDLVGMVSSNNGYIQAGTLRWTLLTDD